MFRRCFVKLFDVLMCSTVPIVCLRGFDAFYGPWPFPSKGGVSGPLLVNLVKIGFGFRGSVGPFSTRIY